MSAAEAIASLFDATAIFESPMDGCVYVFLLIEILCDAGGLNTIWRQPSTRSPGETIAGAASLVVNRAGQAGVGGMVNRRRRR
jgi:pyrroline-5-carboxylate reductase